MEFQSLFLVAICASATQTLALNVLFIGNSYTYVNDVPNLIEKLAQASPARTGNATPM